MKFTDLKLDAALLRAIEDQGYDQPSPIQAKAIPVVLEGRDVMAAAQTGTGKTAGFTLPILHRLLQTKKPEGRGNQARVLVLTPTRELAAQVADSVKTYSQYVKIKSAVVFGGVKINPQMQALRGGIDILIATPGRLLDLHQQNAIQFDKLEVLILDEADRMLDMGFIHDIRRIVKLMPKKRQTLLFSATFSNEIKELSKDFLYKPEAISVSPANSTVDAIQQKLIAVEKNDKSKVLTRLIQDNDWFQVLVFCRTKHGANRLVRQLENRGINAMAIHGNKSQGARTRALAEFKQAKLRVLVATDIAARGIDINNLPHVVNFDLPQVAEDYVHRIGRTGRAGADGEALSLVSHDEFKQLRDIERLIKQVIPRHQLDGYQPLNELPASSDQFAERKPSKPKKAKSKKPAQQREGRGNTGRRKISGNRNSAAGDKSEAAPKSARSNQKRGGQNSNTTDKDARGRNKKSHNTARRNNNSPTRKTSKHSSSNDRPKPRSG